jgi:hypothetical protein
MDLPEPQSEAGNVSGDRHIPPANDALVRLGGVLCFFVALLAGSTAWYVVGGAGHLDMMPWHWKLFPAVAFALAAAKAAVAAASRPRGWNRRSVTWAAIAMMAALVMGAVTYHYHLLEGTEEEPDENPEAQAPL